MANTVVVGTQWGDEGKAKVIDYLTDQADVIIRFQGGANAGHTVVADRKKFVFHLVPSGIMNPEKICVVGNGVVFDIEQFLKEVDEIRAMGVSAENRLFVSDRAHIVLPYHKSDDSRMESSRTGEKIGTTGRGIGPAYADKALRTGIRLGEIDDWDRFAQKVSAQLSWRRDAAGPHGGDNLDEQALLQNFRRLRERILPFIVDTAAYLFDAARNKKRLLFEGAQGCLLDIDHGTYPFVTSSNTIAGAACTGTGIGPTFIDHVIGIVKAYTTRVGNGPFPTELANETGDLLRKVGGEFGATTGRPRRCGWFDSVVARKAAQVNGLTRLALTKIDVLNGLDEILICTHYEINGKKADQFPSSGALFEKARPVYEAVPGWKSDLGTAKKFGDLPSQTVAYIQRLQKLCYDIPILLVSVGPDRKQTIEIEPVTA